MSLREAAEMALLCLETSRVFVTSRQRIKRPEGEDFYDEAINALRAALAEAEKAEPANSTYLDQIAEAKRDMAEWPQWMKDSANISAAVAHPPAALPESVDEDAAIAKAWDRFTAELENPSPLTDEEILELWSPSMAYGIVKRPILGKNKIIAFARSVLAYAANAAARGKG